MAYLSRTQIEEMGFKIIGRNVKISSKASIYNPESIEIGDNSRIDDYSVISGKICIGRNVHIAPFCLVAGGEKGITFSDFSGLAYSVKIFTQSDDYSGNTLTNPTVPRKFKREKKLPIFIGRHAIVGTSAVIFPGVTISEGCAIGAMSLVNESTTPWGIYSGNPAVRLRDRRKKLLLLEEAYLNEDSNDPF